MTLQRELRTDAWHGDSPLRLESGATPDTTAAPQPQQPPVKPENPIWLYRTGSHSDVLPSPVRGIRAVSDWRQVLEIVRKEQGGRENLNVVVYPCAPQQVLE